MLIRKWTKRIIPIFIMTILSNQQVFANNMGAVYSEQQLQEAFHYLREHRDELREQTGLSGYGIDYKNNCLDVCLEDSEFVQLDISMEDRKEIIREAVGMENIDFKVDFGTIEENPFTGILVFINRRQVKFGRISPYQIENRIFVSARFLFTAIYGCLESG